MSDTTSASVTSIEVRNETGLQLNFRVTITPDGRAVVTLLPAEMPHVFHFHGQPLSEEELRQQIRKDMAKPVTQVRLDGIHWENEERRRREHEQELEQQRVNQDMLKRMGIG